MNEAIEQQAFRSFPEYAFSVGFEAALPLFHLPIVARIVEIHDLSVISWYLLKAVSVGVDTPQAVAELLGLRESDLAGPGAELLRASLLKYSEPDQRGVRPLRLTEQGQIALREKKKQPVPRQKTIHLHFDPISRRLSLPEFGVLSSAEMQRESLFVLPYEGSFPSLSDLSVAEVREALLEDSGSFEFDVIALTDLKTVFTEYLRVHVLELRHQYLRDTRVAVYQGFRYRSDVSNALQRLQQRGVVIAPEEAIATLALGPLPLADLPVGVAQPVETAISRERQLDSLRQEVRRREVLRTATQVERERQELEEQIAKLQAQIDLVTTERDNARREASTNADHPVEFISTLQHRPLLEQALASATTEVIILSPWMNPRTVDQSFARLVRKALLRGVRVTIGYGFKSQRPAEDERNQRNARRVISMLHDETVAVRTGKLEIVDLGAIHEKVLICDRSFCAVGSFNWLSYRGDNDAGLRAESSVILRAPVDIEHLAAAKLKQIAEAYNGRRDAQVVHPASAREV